jgi:hypothetical protein
MKGQGWLLGTSRTTQLALQFVVVALHTLQLNLHIFHVGLGPLQLEQDVLLLPLRTGLLNGEDPQTGALVFEVLFQICNYLLCFV